MPTSFFACSSREHKGDDGENDAYDRKDLCDIGGVVCDAAESKDCSNDRDDEEHDGPREHRIPFKDWVKENSVRGKDWSGNVRGFEF